MENTVLEIILRARDEASATLKNLKSSIADVKPGADILTGAFIGMGVAIGGASAYSIKAASDFQSAMTLIQTQAGGSADEVNKMSAAVLNLAGQTATAPEDLAKALFPIESAGYRGAEALDILKLAAEGAKVGHADLSQTADVLTTVMISGVKGVKSSTDAMGVLNATVGAGKMHFQDLVSAMGTGILPVAQQLGFSFQDLGAILATMSNNGVNAQDAATRLKTVLAGMEDPTSKATKALQSIGIAHSQLADDMRSPGGIVTALQDVNDHLKGIVDPTKKAQTELEIFGGGRMGSSMLTLVNNLDQVKGRLKQINGTSASFGDAWKKTSEDAGTSFSRLGATVQTIAIQYGNMLLPAITQMSNFLATNLIPAVTNMSNFFEKNKTILLILAGIITGVVLPAWLLFQAKALVAGALDVAKFIIKNDALILGFLKQTAQVVFAIAQWIIHNGLLAAGAIATGVMTAAQWALNIAMGVGLLPIILIGAAIIALIAIGVLLVTHWKLVQEVAKTVFANIETFFANVGKTAKQVFVQVVNDAINMINGIIDKVDGFIRGANAIASKLHMPNIPEIPHIPAYENGGYVPQTGLAIVHQGEFVLSKAMLAGQQPIPTSTKISQRTTISNNTPITINAEITTDIDLGLLANKIAFAVRNSR